MPSRPGRAGEIAAESVRRFFAGERVLDGASFRAAAGSVAALVGANGSGKTTLLRILAGVLDPDAGSVSVAGSPPGSGLAGFVPGGDRMLNWRLSGRRNLAFFARVAGVPREELDGRLATAAEALAASDLLDRRTGECSTGQRRRLMLAVAFLATPPVVLLDEPYADLDEEGCAAVEAACRSWADAGGVVLYAAPVEGAGPRADLLLRLRDGKIEAAT